MAAAAELFWRNGAVGRIEPNDWWKGAVRSWSVLGYIDDGDSAVEARFYDHEGTMPALDSFRGWVQRYGIPCSVYLDKHTTYRSPQTPTVEEQLQGHEQSQSQFQRAMSELGVEVIHAHSPAAKGRIERLFQTLQDRLVRNYVWLGLRRCRRPTRFWNAICRCTISVSSSKRLSPRTCIVGCRHDWISIGCFA